MADMLLAADARNATLTEAIAGSLVLVCGYSFSGFAGLVVQNVNGLNEVFMLEGVHLGIAAIDVRTPLVSLGQAVARFDRSSFADGNALLPTNSLILAGNGTGVYEASNFAPRGGTLALLTGLQAQFYRHHETPAFLHWEIGYHSNDEFVQVAEIDLRK